MKAAGILPGAYTKCNKFELSYSYKPTGTLGDKIKGRRNYKINFNLLLVFRFRYLLQVETVLYRKLKGVPEVLITVSSHILAFRQTLEGRTNSTALFSLFDTISSRRIQIFKAYWGNAVNKLLMK